MFVGRVDSGVGASPCHNNRGRTSIAILVLLIVAAAASLLIWWSLPPISTAQSAADRMACSANLRQILAALNAYHDSYGGFPPAYLESEDGVPMHSWRVMILPFFGSVEANDLYARYNFDEPWNGPMNRRLLEGGTPLFKCPTDRASRTYTTSYVAVVGSDTAWPGAESTKLAEFRDGPYQTITVVEIADSGIPWTAPFDLNKSGMPLRLNVTAQKCMSSRHPGGAHLGSADGKVAFILDSCEPEVIGKMLTIAGGETFPPAF